MIPTLPAKGEHQWKSGACYASVLFRYVPRKEKEQMQKRTQMKNYNCNQWDETERENQGLPLTLRLALRPLSCLVLLQFPGQRSEKKEKPLDKNRPMR
jgi:hypothetical protein